MFRYTTNILFLISSILTYSIAITTNLFNISMPEYWSNEWNNSIIPYVFNFYSPSPKRLVSLVQKGHSYIEERSCLEFKEHDPRLLASTNFTYLYYTYSGVLENCCLPFFNKLYGRRLVLITPLCTLPAEVAHATMHAMGLQHKKSQPFLKNEVKTILFLRNCEQIDYKRNVFENRMDYIFDKK